MGACIATESGEMRKPPPGTLLAYLARRWLLRQRKSFTVGLGQHIHRSPPSRAGHRVSCSPCVLTGGFRQLVIFGGVDPTTMREGHPDGKVNGGEFGIRLELAPGEEPAKVGNADW